MAGSALTIAQTLTILSKKLEGISDSPRLDAEILLEHACGITRTQLYTNPEKIIEPKIANALESCVNRRLQGEPIAYIIGHKEFWSLDFIVTQHTLIPRPETEHLVEWVLNYLPAENSYKIADIGTGSGAIAIAIAHERPKWEIHASDYSVNALNIAKINAQNNSIKNISFFEGNLLGALPSNNYHVIISNPPYIGEEDPHLPSLRYEPKDALVAEENGFYFLRKIIEHAKDYLQSEGILIVEHGINQGEKTRKIMLKNNFKEIKTHHDLAGIDRFTVGIK